MERYDFGRYKALFGVQPADLSRGQASNTKQSQRVSAVGAELWRDLGNGQWEFMPVKLGDVQLWNPIMRISMRKTVIETPLVERGGSVKEIIGIDDYIINIRGVIKGQARWPEDDLNKLVELWNKNEAVPIISPRTAMLRNGQEQVVITNMQLPEHPGRTEIVPYEIECVTDIPFVLELDENGN